MTKSEKTNCPCHIPEQGCPLESALSVFGGKWKIQIICLLYIHEILRYNDLKRSIQGVTSTMLSSSLKELESHGIVRRKQYDEMPVRVEYSLTELGHTLIPVLGSIREWGIEHAWSK